MELENLPIRLSDTARKSWEDYLLDHIPDRSKGELRRRLEAGLGLKSARSLVSKFLNGHGEELYQWFTNEDRREVLRDVLGLDDLERLQGQLVTLLPGRVGALRLMPDDLDYFPLWVRKRSYRTFGERAVSLPRERLLGDLLRENPTARFVEPPIGSLSSWLAATLLNRALERLGDRPGPWNIEVDPHVTTDHIVEWTTALAGAGRVPNELPTLMKAAEPLDALLLLNAEELVSAIQEFIDGRIDDFSEETLAARRLAWARERVRQKGSPLVRRWLLRSGAFFIEWAKTAGSLHDELTPSEVRAALASDSDDSIQSWDVLSALSDIEDETGHEIIGQFIAAAPQDVFLHLKDAGLIRGACAVALSPELRELGELEGAMALRAADLQSLNPIWNFSLVASACHLATTETTIGLIDAATSRGGIAQPALIEAALLGLLKRYRGVDDLPDAPLIRLWASAVWAFGTSLHQRQPTFAQRDLCIAASEYWRARLPSLDPADPVGHLRSIVAPVLIETTTRWGATAPSVADLSRVIPFQLPYTDKTAAPFLWHEESAVRLAVHRARCGDTGAREFVVSRFENAVPVEEQLGWVNDLASHAAEQVCFRGLQAYVAGDSDLLPALRAVRSHCMGLVLAELSSLDRAKSGQTPHTTDAEELEKLRCVAEVFEDDAALHALFASNDEKIRVWACRHDVRVLRQWCADHALDTAEFEDSTVELLCADLELADLTWPHLSVSAQRALLRRLPQTQSERWWSRRHVLAPGDELEFARRQGLDPVDVDAATIRVISEGGSSSERLELLRQHDLGRRLRYPQQAEDEATFLGQLSTLTPTIERFHILDRLLASAWEARREVGDRIVIELIQKRLELELRLEESLPVAPTSAWVPLSLSPADKADLMRRVSLAFHRNPGDDDPDVLLDKFFATTSDFDRLNEHLHVIPLESGREEIAVWATAVANLVLDPEQIRRALSTLVAYGATPEVVAEFLDRHREGIDQRLVPTLLELLAKAPAGPARQRVQQHLVAAYATDA